MEYWEFELSIYLNSINCFTFCFSSHSSDTQLFFADTLVSLRFPSMKKLLNLDAPLIVCQFFLFISLSDSSFLWEHLLEYMLEHFLECFSNWRSESSQLKSMLAHFFIWKVQHLYIQKCSQGPLNIFRFRIDSFSASFAVS